VQIAITVAIYVILKENIADKIRITTIIIVLGLIGVAIFLNSPFLRDTYGERFLAIFNEDIEDSSRDNRDLLRLNAFAAFLNRPIFGNGVNYSAVTNGAVLGIRVYSHCNYVEMLCNYGIVGFILYYAMYAYMIIRAFAMRQSMYAKMVLSCIIPLIIIEYGQVTYYVRVGVFPIMVLFLLARYGIKQRKENEGQN